MTHALLSDAFAASITPVLALGAKGLLALIVSVLDLIAIVSVLMGRGSVGHKLLWILLILVLPVVGLILYFLLGRSPKDL